MKACTKCREQKPLTEFTKRKRSPDGLRLDCRACTNAANMAWKKANPGRVIAMHDTWYAANADRLRAGCRRWKQAHPEKHCAIQGKHRSSRLLRTPAWADIDAIARIYAEAQEQRKQGHDVHVDHYYPLQGRTVSGLHVHQNLRVLPAKVNLAKGNKIIEGGA